MDDVEAIDYEVISCSNEDPDHPASAIRTRNINGSGWLSGENPKYPIEIVIKLSEIKKIKAIQIVSHQYMIPAIINLSFGKKENVLKPMGSFEFSDNKESGNKGRECKTLNLQHVSLRYLKLTICGCHQIPDNRKRQAGIILVKLLGPS